ncbi:MAG: hypothetical protein D3923_10450 [Candidatus Electrothrix sp. AR3]|nr:hypothetical protein [Candidatus Electrothrix sp. AR3]
MEGLIWRRYDVDLSGLASYQGVSFRIRVSLKFGSTNWARIRNIEIREREEFSDTDETLWVQDDDYWRTEGNWNISEEYIHVTSHKNSNAVYQRNFDLSALQNPVLYFESQNSSNFSLLYIDISYDNGQSWEEISELSLPQEGPIWRRFDVDLSGLASYQGVSFRIRAYLHYYSYWARIRNIEISEGKTD